MDKAIREAIFKDITAKDYSILGFTLTCSEEFYLSAIKNEEMQTSVLFGASFETA